MDVLQPERGIGSGQRARTSRRKANRIPSVRPLGEGMELLAFLAFLVASHFLLMQVFRLTTYHAYFWKALPLLVGYSALVGWLLYAFGFHQFFLWQVVLASAWLFIVGRKQDRLASAMLQMAGDDGDAVRFAAESTKSTSRYYAYSSFVYVICFSLTYLWFYNRV